jgi:hypothetical protein
MAILLKETKFSQLAVPEAGYILLGLDSETGNIKYMDSTGESQTLSIDVGGDITGDSSVIGSTASGATYGLYYLANGLNVTPTGNYSHPEGNQTTTLAAYSHAEGYKTTASAVYAHSQGEYTTAAGIASLTGGIGSATYLVIASGSAAVNISSTNTRMSDITGSNSAILGGVDNLIGNSTSSVIIGGTLNTINGISNNGIFAGVSNTINNTSQNSVILGGDTNVINTAGICDAIIASTNSSIASSSSYVSIIGLSGYTASSFNNVIYMPSIALVNSTASPNVNGAIRYNGTTFQGYKSGWISLERPTDYVTTGTTQSISGAKTFSAATIFSSTAAFSSTTTFSGRMTCSNVITESSAYQAYNWGADTTVTYIPPLCRTLSINITQTAQYVDSTLYIDLDNNQITPTAGSVGHVLFVTLTITTDNVGTSYVIFRDFSNNTILTLNQMGSLTRTYSVILMWTSTYAVTSKWNYLSQYY